MPGSATRKVDRSRPNELGRAYHVTLSQAREIRIQPRGAYAIGRRHQSNTLRSTSGTA